MEGEEELCSRRCVAGSGAAAQLLGSGSIDLPSGGGDPPAGPVTGSLGCSPAVVFADFHFINAVSETSPDGLPLSLMRATFLQISASRASRAAMPGAA